jgi:6-phosphogluconolactonase (cycloisomerase 2 family)/uncharacterized protein YjdB
LQYAATALFSNGSTQDVSSTATWSSSNTSVAQISATGLATGVGLGTTNIGATYKDVSATSEPLAVDQLNSITVSPTPVTVPLGASQPFVAVGNFTFAAGGSSDLDVSSQVTWDSTDKTVATIDNTGNATTVGTGTTTITATSCDGITVGRATLNVNSPAATSLVVTPATITISTGTTTLFTAMEKLSNGTIQALPQGTVVTWSSDAASVATVDPNSGVALGVAAGAANITVSSSGLNSGSAVLTVQAATARFAYVADAQGGASFSGTISGYSVDLTSATPLASLGSPVAASSPQQVLLHPSGDLMYYLDSGGFLHIDDVNSSDGSFSEANQSPTRASTSSSSFNVGVIDPKGRFIYVTSGVDNTIYGFSIAQTADKSSTTNGALTEIPSFNPYNDGTLNSPTWIMTDRAGNYAYVVNSGSNTISEYSIDQTTGALTPLTGSPTIATGTTPLFATTDVNGHVYVANQGPPQSVSGYSINSSTGQLTSVGADTPITGATFTINVITDPTGKYLYVLDSTSGPPSQPPSQVFAFNLNPATGVIGSQIGSPLLTGNSPFGMAIDPTGSLMAIDNNFDNTISLFTIGSASSSAPGGLTAASPPTVATDTQPLFVTFYTAASDQ